MPYDLTRHHRRSTRLRGFDYASAAACFVTICTRDRLPLFGQVEEGRMRLNALGRIVAEEWHRSEAARAEVRLDAFVVMPDHVHGIVCLVPPGTSPGERPDPHGYVVADADRRGMARHAPTAPPAGRAFGRPVAHSLPTVVGAFKSAVTRRINRLRGTPGETVWQRGYYDRIIRSERAWHAVRRYIERNPARWA